MARRAILVISLFAVSSLGVALALHSQDDAPAWKRGRGWGWIWGAEDELGALNHMSDDSRLAALSLIEEGRVYDLGITYSRNSFVWPGHNPGEVMSFRSPDGIERQGDHGFTGAETNPAGVAWHSCALFVSDNVATQIDSLAHITVGEDDHWYNGFTEAEAGGDFGVRRCSAAGIPPVVNRAVLLDIAGLEGVESLGAMFAITPEHCRRAMERQGVEVRVGDLVFVRTGSIRHWGEDGADHETIKVHDTAGITLETARFLVEELGAMGIGSDTSGVECGDPGEGADTFVPVHKYLLVEQGVHLFEFHDLEALARDGVWEFCYVGLTNKIAGTAAGFAMRPIALR